MSSALSTPSSEAGKTTGDVTHTGPDPVDEARSGHLAGGGVEA